MVWVSCSIGSYGAIVGAKIVASTISQSTIRPASAPGLRVSLRNVSLAKPPDLDLSSSDAIWVDGAIVAAWDSGIANSRVEDCIGKVDQQIDHHIDHRRNQHGSLDERVIAVVDGGDGHAPQTRT